MISLAFSRWKCLRLKQLCLGKVKWSCYRPDVAQRVGSGIALLFRDRGTRRGWVVSSTPRPHFTPGKDPVLILQEAGWAPGPVGTGGKSRPHRNSIPDRPAPSQWLYRLSYPAHICLGSHSELYMWSCEVLSQSPTLSPFKTLTFPSASPCISNV